MKKTILFFFITVLCMPSLLAQGSGEKNDFASWRFGLRIQPSLSWLRTPGNDFENGKAKFNFGYGLMVEKSLLKSTYLTTGFFINDIGGNYKYTGLDKTICFKDKSDSIFFTSRKLMLKYVELPIALKFRTPEINYLTYTAHFGVDVGFRIKATADESFRDAQNANAPGLYQAIDIKNDVSFMRLGLNVGIGAEYSLAGSTSLIAGFSYVNGFTNILRKESELLRYKDDPAKVKQIFYGHAVVLHIGVLF